MVTFNIILWNDAGVLYSGLVKKIGGVCLNRGCIPTKTILHSAEVYEDLKCSDDLGIKCDGLSFDFARVVERKEKTVEKFYGGYFSSLQQFMW